MLAQPTIDLAPLAAFLPPAALDRLVVISVEPASLPGTARRLLDHDQDMTSTLEEHLDEPLRLRVLSQGRGSSALRRLVVLVGANSGRAAEYGAIRIALDSFSDAARRDIVAGERPLGALLADHRVAYTSAPHAFIRMRADADVARAFGTGMRDGETLWGRLNVLTTPARVPLAQVVEILPPALAGS